MLLVAYFYLQVSFAVAIHYYGFFLWLITLAIRANRQIALTTNGKTVLSIEREKHQELAKNQPTIMAEHTQTQINVINILRFICPPKQKYLNFLVKSNLDFAVKEIKMQKKIKTENTQSAQYFISIFNTEKMSARLPEYCKQNQFMLFVMIVQRLSDLIVINCRALDCVVGRRLCCMSWKCVKLPFNCKFI